jgi:hypothetical protein
LEFIFLHGFVADTGDNLGTSAGNVKQIVPVRAESGRGDTVCLWSVQEYTATSDGVVVAPLYRSSACSADSSECFCAGVQVHAHPRVVTLPDVPVPGRIECAYQNQIPPALPMLSSGEAFDRSFSFAASVLSNL